MPLVFVFIAQAAINKIAKLDFKVIQSSLGCVASANPVFTVG
jgi:hypothetical protein